MDHIVDFVVTDRCAVEIGNKAKIRGVCYVVFIVFDSFSLFCIA